MKIMTKREAVSILMLSPYYFSQSLAERLQLVKEYVKCWYES